MLAHNAETVPTLWKLRNHPIMMRFISILLFLLTFSTCAKETIEPVDREIELYYLVIRFAPNENSANLKDSIYATLKPFGRYRITSLVIGDNQQEPVFTIRRCNTHREGAKLLKVLRKEPDFKYREMRVVSQSEYREMLKKRSFYSK